MIEGVEVVFIVIAIGAGSAGALASAAFGAALAVAAAALAGVALRGPLTRIPENTLKFAVGVLLSAFGAFWAGQGLGLEWPGEDLSILLLVIGFLAVALAGVRRLRPFAEP
jgi:Ca2+/H+ antiporter, TMEM165/GDT1 family